MSSGTRDNRVTRDCHMLTAAPCTILPRTPLHTHPQARCRSLAAGCCSPLPTPRVWPGQTGGEKRRQTQLSPPWFLLSQHPKACQAAGRGCVPWDQAQPFTVGSAICPGSGHHLSHGRNTQNLAEGNWVLGADGTPQGSPLLSLVSAVGPPSWFTASQQSSALPREPITLSC